MRRRRFHGTTEEIDHELSRIDQFRTLENFLENWSDFGRMASYYKVHKATIEQAVKNIMLAIVNEEHPFGLKNKMKRAIELHNKRMKEADKKWEKEHSQLKIAE